MSRVARAVSLAVCALGIYFAAYATQRFYWFGLPPMKPGFADLRQLFASAECANLGEPVYERNTCDEWGRPYSYSTAFLRSMQFLRLTRSDTNPVALSLVLLFTAACAALLVPRTRAQFAVGLAVLASPSFVLGVERCNLDIVICAGLILVAALVTSPKPQMPEWLAVGVILVGATFTKYYPLLAVPAILAIRPDRESRIRIATAAAALVAVYFLAFPEDLGHIRTATPSPGLSRFAFGAVYLTRKLGPVGVAHAAAVAAAGLLVAGGWFLGRRGPAPVGNGIDRNARAWILMGSGVYLGCFILHSNFDYRRVFLVMALPALFHLLADASPRRRAAARAAIILLVALLWSMMVGRLLAHAPGEALSRGLTKVFLAFRQAADWAFAPLLSFCAAAAFGLPARDRAGAPASA